MTNRSPDEKSLVLAPVTHQIFWQPHLGESRNRLYTPRPNGLSSFSLFIWPLSRPKQSIFRQPKGHWPCIPSRLMLLPRLGGSLWSFQQLLPLGRLAQGCLERMSEARTSWCGSGPKKWVAYFDADYGTPETVFLAWMFLADLRNISTARWV